MSKWVISDASWEGLKRIESLIVVVGFAVAVFSWIMQWPTVLTVVLFSLCLVSVLLIVLGALGVLPGKRSSPIAIMPLVESIIQGVWRKTYTWKGKPGAETAVIKGDGYYLKGETEPRYWLRDASYDPSTRKLQFKMISTRDGKVWDTETLVLSLDQRSMSGQSETFGHDVRYERLLDENYVGDSGQ